MDEIPYQICLEWVKNMLDYVFVTVLSGTLIGHPHIVTAVNEQERPDCLISFFTVPISPYLSIHGPSMLYEDRNGVTLSMWTIIVTASCDTEHAQFPTVFSIGFVGLPWVTVLIHDSCPIGILLSVIFRLRIGGSCSQRGNNQEAVEHFNKYI